MTVEGNLVTVDGWKFEIDRSVPRIKGNLGQSEIILTKEITKYLGKNANAKYEVQAIITIESKKEIEKVVIEKPDKTTIEIKPSEDKLKITKNITMELDKEYKTTIKTINGKTEERIIIENSVETIKTKEELVAFGEKVNNGLTYEGKTVSLVNDIDLGGSESNRNWETIGDFILDENKNFVGIFEGNNHKIFNLYNKDTTKGRQGFFGAINGGTVQNLGIESGNIKGGWTAGGIAGRIDNGNIKNCYNKAKIEGGTVGNTGAIGGIVGLANNNTTVLKCYNEGIINGIYELNGGIVGNVMGGSEILSCYNIASVTGDTYTGGIAGYIQNSGSLLNNCYNKGNIESTTSIAGGIVGGNEASSEVKNAYNIGAVIAPETIGGVIGINNGKFTNVFFARTTETDYYGCGTNSTEYWTNRITEENFAQLKERLNEGQSDNPWKEDVYNINQGYPILSWQKVPNESEEK